MDTLDTIFTWVIGIGLAILALQLYFRGAAFNERKRTALEVRTIADFDAEKSVLKVGRNTMIARGLAIDHARRKLCLVNGRDKRVVPYESVLSAEVVVDGATITKVSRSSQLTGAAVGGLALGGVGALIGGLSARTTSSQKVTSVELRLLIDSLDAPSHSIEFMELTATGETVPEAAKREAQEWCDMMRVVIARNAIDRTPQAEQLV